MAKEDPRCWCDLQEEASSTFIFFFPFLPQDSLTLAQIYSDSYYQLFCSCVVHSCLLPCQPQEVGAYRLGKVTKYGSEEFSFYSWA